MSLGSFINIQGLLAEQAFWWQLNESAESVKFVKLDSSWRTLVAALERVKVQLSTVDRP